MHDNTILSHRPGLMTADMNGSAVMMDIVTGKYYNLGEVGGRIWELLEEPTSLASLIETLTTEFDVTAEQCRLDTVPFLEKLVRQGLLTRK